MSTSSLLPPPPLFLILLLFPLAAAAAAAAAAAGGGGGRGEGPLRSAEKTVHDYLPEYGLPRGLLPSSVRNYSMSTGGEFVVELEAPCYVQFSELVYYESTVRGRLSYGVISNLSGIQARKFFVWVYVTTIVADPPEGGGMIEFDAGFLSEKLPAYQFALVPICTKPTSAPSSTSSSPRQGGVGLSASSDAAAVLAVAAV